MEPRQISQRFRGFLPVVVDIETGGVKAATDAVLQIAAVMVHMEDNGTLYVGETHTSHVEPFEGANLDPKSLEFNGIDPDHPLRMAIPESEALPMLFKPIREAIKQTGCTRAVLVGHNAWFDLGFLNAAVERCGIKRNPFHPFSCFDTATLSGLAYGQTVLARGVAAAGLDWDAREAHSAIYDAEKTAELFCTIVNRWDALTDTQG
ncbi:ribonuclease T [Spiribacter salinus M19-40]|jgi:ribonuclease T|uniref:Ribonuclease T n=2 Tax=Spiribacter salinus TaxID=1335746 RepID=R4VE45_9GAMM|nr:ribonuclease T [Spiribacter salinus]AGM40586.1 ribonuclease T [Spiribacter salinus M19-40]MDR9413415.1 ribonuclease T [Spiribacter sp.]MDR9454291.1 ribonuclease T [Spiribacter sp.]TQF00977.1 MAG: ribonuclease T [Spiribacter salinus]